MNGIDPDLDDDDAGLGDGDEEAVYHQDGVPLEGGALLIANAYEGDPDAQCSEMAVHAAGAWERFDVPTDCIVTLASGRTQAYAVGRHGLYLVLPSSVGSDVDAWMGRIRMAVIPQVHDIGELTRCKVVDGTAYCVGQCGQVYRLGPKGHDDYSFGLQSDDGPDLEGLDGLAADCLYACGPQGTVLHFDGRAWRALDVPTNLNFSSVLVQDRGSVFVAGDRGTLLHLHQGRWTTIEGDPERNYWDICSFGGWPVLSHTGGIDYFDGRMLRPLPVGLDASLTYYRLAASGDLLLSTGQRHVLTIRSGGWSLVDED